MRFMDIGGDKTGKVAILLHGKNFSGFYWERIAEELKKKGYRVIIPDQIGFGKSSKPAVYDYSFSQWAVNTVKLLDHLSVKHKVVVVGHSMGGMLASHLSYLYPERFQKMILVNPIGLERYADFVEMKDPQFFYDRIESKEHRKGPFLSEKNITTMVSGKSLMKNL